VTTANRNQVFISYSKKDLEWLRQIKKALRPFIRKNRLVIWDDSHIKAGDKWRDKIAAALGHARVAVMLVSRDFLASDFIVNVELPTLLEKARKKGLRIIWVPVGECAVETTDLSEYQAAIDPTRPLTSLTQAELDKALLEIARAINAAANTTHSLSGGHTNRSFLTWPIYFFRRWPIYSAAIAFLIAAIVYGAVWSKRTAPKAQGEVTILVANLDGPEDYKITQTVLARMREAVQNKIPNVKVIPLDRKITEQEGPDKAIEEGRNADANLVLWGYYNSSYRGQIHIEQLKTPERLHLLKDSFDLNPSIENRRGISVEEDLSSELNYLILIVTGLTRFESGAFQAAIDCYNRALKERSAPEQLLDQLQIYHFLVLAYLYLDADEALEYFDLGSNKGDSDRFYLANDESNKNHYLIDEAISNFTTVLSSKPDDSNTRYWRAHGYARKGDYTNALTDYDQLLKDSPNDVEALIGRGIVHNLMKEFDLAIADYNKAAALAPNNTELYYNRGISLEQRGDYEQALADYNHAVSIDKYDVDSKISRALLLSRLGYSDDASNELTNAFEGVSPAAFYYFRRGQAWEEIGNSENALADFSVLSDLNPSLGFHLRGHLFRDLKRYDEAIADFTKVCSLDPKAGYARNDLATCWVSKHNDLEAIKYYQEATEIEPSWGFSWVNRGLAHWRLKDKEQALFCLKKGSEITFAERHMAYYFLAQLKTEIGDYWGAIEDYASAIQLQPEFVDLWMLKAPLWLKVERYDTAMYEYRTAFTFLEAVSFPHQDIHDGKTYEAAVDNLTTALQHNPRNKDGYFARGLAYLLDGKAEAALKDIKHAVALDPKFAETYLLEGTALISLKRYEEARKSLTKAIELDPNFFRAIFRRAMTYMVEGQNDLALTELSHALTISPSSGLARLNRGIIYVRKKDYQSAREDFYSIPSDVAAYDQVLLYRGLLKVDIGDRERAKIDLQRASQIARSGEIQQQAAEALIRLGAPIGR
jgi:tetratricopeptide (TPR) repeat protein